MAVEDLMSRNVECATPEQSLRAAGQRMHVHNVGCLPVCEKGKLVGIITDRDIVVRAVAKGLDPNKTKVKDVMSAHPTFCTPDQEIGSVAKTMENNLVRRLPVLDENGRLVGVISVSDFAREGEGRDLVAEVLNQVSGQHA